MSYKMPSQVIRMPTTSHHRNVSNSNGDGGIEICCCRVCTCIHLGFITSKHGMLKLIEVIMGSMVETLLLRFGMPYANDMGQAFNSFMTTASAFLMTSMILFGCYIISNKTFNLVRQSLFEVVFNTVGCCMYLSAASYMGFAVNVWLYPRFVITPAYMAYPAMTGCYVSYFILTIICQNV